MNIFQIALLSIIEGLTEFLPISTTAHLIIFSKLLRIQASDFHKLFEVFIQGGAILSVIFLYKKLIFEDERLILNVLVAFLPTAFFGFVFYKLIKNVFFENIFLISFSLIFIGLIFIFIEYLIFKRQIILNKKIKNLGFKESFLIGFFQSLAIIPGVSRAGIVMISMMILGYKRNEAAIFSFLLAVPTIISASLFDLYKNKDLLFLSNNNLFYLFLGSFLSFVFALISIKIFITFLGKKNLVGFGIYRIFLGIINLFLIK
ncbi:MAG: undecaprenyl-diphosphate phosphatase [Minisyncoccia bacterium]